MPPPPPLLLLLLQLLLLPPPGEVSLPTLAWKPDPERSGARGQRLQPAAGWARGALRARAGVGASAVGSGWGWGRWGGGGAAVRRQIRAQRRGRSASVGAGAAAMAVRSRRPWMSVALGLVLGFTAASWLIAPRVAELSERKRRGSSLCSYYGRSAAGPGAHQPLPQPRPRLEQSPPPALQELQGPQLPEAAAGVTSFRSSPWQQPPPLQQRRRGREPEGTTGLPGAPVAEGEPEEEDGGAAGQRRGGRPGSSHNGSGDGGAAAPSSRPRDFLYVGVMTAQKYLGSRALAAQRTWARFIPGRVEFFSSQQPPNAGLGQPPPPLPVIELPGVDDSYPPQKKSFMMIKYMHDHYLDKYEWFMRADDDVYIKGDLPAPAVPPARLLSLLPVPTPVQPSASLPARAPGSCSPQPAVPTPRLRPPLPVRSSSPPAASALLTPARLYSLSSHLVSSFSLSAWPVLVTVLGR